jgi:mono/diheme cytochrome c family protein
MVKRHLDGAVAISMKWGAAVLVAGWICCLSGQEKAPVSVWDGIYTDGQAARGEPVYRKNCISCHGEELEGKGQNPPLSGSDFTTNWNGMTVGDLFEKMQVSMPADRPGKLSKEENAEMLAYILKFNKFPTGAKELPASADALSGIRFEPEPKGK